jgi:hypothetical protein
MAKVPAAPALVLHLQRGCPRGRTLMYLKMDDSLSCGTFRDKPALGSGPRDCCAVNRSGVFCRLTDGVDHGRFGAAYSTEFIVTPRGGANRREWPTLSSCESCSPYT